MAVLTWLEDGVPKLAALPREGARVLGRNEEADIAIASPDKTISRRHARLAVRGGSHTIENLSATNITRVNGVALSGPAALSDRDALQLGTSVLTFHDVSRSVMLSGLICDNCKRENPASQKDCWFCGQNLVNALSVALRNRMAACRVVQPNGAALDVFVGRSAGIRADGGVEPVRSGQAYAARIEASADNIPSLIDGSTSTAIPESRAITVAGRTLLVLLP